MVSQKDRKIIRELALKWMELASLDVMTDRKRLWKAVHDLKAERPVILFETAWVDGCRQQQRPDGPAIYRTFQSKSGPA